uniref:Elfless, isoform B n=2 Tax=Drosophila melanogaster TaxID=7227 RepID=Q9VJB0_DROME|eukprot:NP_001163003.1 elfless, isoform B [Drosophila melanogaster]
MGDSSDSDSSTEWEQNTRVISLPFSRNRSHLSSRLSYLVGLQMENFRTSNNSGVSQRIHNTGPTPVLAPSGLRSRLLSGSSERNPNEYYGDSDSSSSSRSIDRTPFLLEYSSDSESSSSSDSESSSTSISFDSSMSSTESSTPMGHTESSDSNEDSPPNKRIKSDDEESKKSVLPYNCPVCLEDVREKLPVSTNCGHVFCKACIKRAVDTGRVCPLCGVDEPEFHRIFL